MRPINLAVQRRVIRALNETPGLDMGALAMAANILPPSLSRMTKSLEKRGPLDMRRTPGDGRRASLSLIAKGKTLIQTIAPDGTVNLPLSSDPVGPQIFTEN